MHLGWSVRHDGIVWFTEGKKHKSGDGYNVILRPGLKIADDGELVPIPEGTEDIFVGTIFNHKTLNGWYMCGRLGLHGVDHSKGEFYGIDGFRTGKAAAFQLLKERGFKDGEARF